MTTELSFTAKCHSAQCRSCRRQELLPVLNLGQMPLSDGLLTAEQLAAGEQRYPLEVAFCPNCSLVQILETVPPETLFCEDYPYYSSFSQALLEHSQENAVELIQQRNLGPESLVVELASNDGYLLKNFIARGIPVLGIDPAEGPAMIATSIGVPTLNAFFGKELAARLVHEGTRADVIIANNVLAHVADTNGFVEGIRVLLKEDGVAVVEVPYLRRLIERCEFDTIYHEHLCYFSMTSLDSLFRRHGLYINDVRELTIHGGSLRLYAESAENVGEAVRSILADEAAAGIDSYEYYKGFSAKVDALRQSMRKMLAGLKSSGKRIAAYGAAAKGAIMLNYIGVGTDTIDFVVDRNTHKQGKFMPGVHIPIHEPDRILKDMPDYVVILPWNFKDEILSQQALYREKGGKFIVPVPWPEVI